MRQAAMETAMETVASMHCVVECVVQYTNSCCWSALAGRMLSPTTELEDDDFDDSSVESAPQSKRMKLVRLSGFCTCIMYICACALSHTMFTCMYACVCINMHVLCTSMHVHTCIQIDIFTLDARFVNRYEEDR